MRGIGTLIPPLQDMNNNSPLAKKSGMPNFEIWTGGREVEGTVGGGSGAGCMRSREVGGGGSWAHSPGGAVPDHLLAKEEISERGGKTPSLPSLLGHLPIQA